MKEFEMACRNADQIYLNKQNKQKPKDQRLRKRQKKMLKLFFLNFIRDFMLNRKVSIKLSAIHFQL